MSRFLLILPCNLADLTMCDAVPVDGAGTRCFPEQDFIRLRKKMKKATILVIDDEKDMLTLLMDFLEVRGYSVIAADNGSDGFDLARLRRPDLIILDISMPDMDGGQVAQELRETPRTEHIPIIFLTALLSKESEKENKHMIGGNIMFAKPCDFDELAKQIEMLLAVPAL